MTGNELVRHINTQGAVVLRGTQQLRLLRAAIEQAMKAAGFTVTFDPESEPDIVDVLTVSTLNGLEGAALGSALGALLGALFGCTRDAALAGLAIGGAVGVVRGVERVQRGWRIRAVRDAAGEPVVEVEVK